MQIDSEILKKIRNFGALNIPFFRVPILLQLNKSDSKFILDELNKTDSELRLTYDEGAAMGDYNKEAAIEKEAEKGDSFALQNQRYYRQQKKIDILKQDLFGI